MHSTRFVVAIALILSALPLAADEGRIPIPFQAPVTFPILINAPGKYVLTRDLVGPGTDAVLKIASTDVEIDLNGKVISGGFPGIQINLGAEAVIRNGAIESGGIGIDASAGGADVTVDDVRISQLTGDGINLQDPDTFVIRRCIIENVLNGIAVFNGSLAQGTIESNVIRRATTAVLLSNVTGAEISRNRIRESSSRGIWIDGESSGILISQNTIVDSGQSGIELAAWACTLHRNIVLNSGTDGQSAMDAGILVFSNGNLILDNIVRSSFGDGIRVSGNSNQINGNLLTANGAGGEGFGLRFDFGLVNTFGRNTAVGNAGGACAVPHSGLNDLCNEALVGGNFSFGDNLMPPSAGLF